MAVRTRRAESSLERKAEALQESWWQRTDFGKNEGKGGHHKKNHGNAGRQSFIWRNLGCWPPEKLLLWFAAHQAVAILLTPYRGVCCYPLQLAMETPLLEFRSWTCDVSICLEAITGGKGAEAARMGKWSSPEHYSEFLWEIGVHFNDCLSSREIYAPQLSAALGLQPSPKLEAGVPRQWGDLDCPVPCRGGARVGSST